MDFSSDVFQIYCQYCDITSRATVNEGGCYGPDEESQKARISREALAQLLKVVESKVSTRVSILEEVYKLMSRLELMADFSEFSRFYDFVFFICRENGQKSITVSRAVMAWRLVLAGRFRLLNEWCDFVEKNHRHNISEDTWRQVLAFSRCVHENLEGYDPEVEESDPFDAMSVGAWPILIDDFVEHMYRIRGSHGASSLFCNCGDSESQQCEDILSGLKNFPGSKRKFCDNLQMGEESSDGYASSSSIANSKKRQRYSTAKCANWGQNQVGSIDDCVETVKHSSTLGCTKSPCAVEGCLSKGFAGLLSGRSCLQFHQDRRVSYT
ncbi:UNVERIFIED_CONTAM: DCN1-like protein [Sesamum calycinum]|uniref:Defective in cullin neddylation protein n=1 Tax=Sesamum calycinum TaxID=2727403 RepID=A0AAW2MN26_9LAMI